MPDRKCSRRWPIWLWASFSRAAGPRSRTSGCSPHPTSRCSSLRGSVAGPTPRWPTAALELVTSLHGSAVPVLLEALADAEPASRRWAVHCLRKIGRAAAPAIPVLQRLRDNDPQTLIRQEAARPDAIEGEP